MNKAVLTVLLALTGAWVAACGGSVVESSTGGTGGAGHEGTGGAGHGGTSGGGPTAMAACADVSKARCDKLAMCSNGAQITARWGDAATCEARLAIGCEASLGAPGTGSSPAESEACASAMPGESCTDFFDDDPPTACLPQAGSAEDGAACAFNAQCKSTYCDVPKGAACGTCSQPPKVGDACAENADCWHDQVCVKETSTCASPVAAGGACGKSAPCGAGLSCVGATMAAMGTCKPAASAVGAACDPKRLTASECDRDLGLYCNPTTKQCAAIAYAPAGQPCGVVNGAVVDCAGGATCKIPAMAKAGTCVATAPDGAACDLVAGPGCLSPARCVLIGGGGTAGKCTLPTSGACP